MGIVKKGQNPARRPKNGPPSGRTATYRKTEVIQSYLRMWGSYDPIESGPSEPKKWGLYGRSVKKCRFSGQKWAAAAAPRPTWRNLLFTSFTTVHALQTKYIQQFGKVHFAFWTPAVVCQPVELWRAPVTSLHQQEPTIVLLIPHPAHCFQSFN